MFNLAPWFYRDLLDENNILDKPEFFETILLNEVNCYEAVISLKNELRPHWLVKSDIYRDCDGSGTSKYKNIAVYKSLSEALERLAFYELVDLGHKEYCFHLNPTTTGMAAYPGITGSQARFNAKMEAIERWAIHEFNRAHLPIKKHKTDIQNLDHYEIIVPFTDVRVSLLSYVQNSIHIYGFAGGKNLKHSFEKSLIELDRNIRVLLKAYSDEKGNRNYQATVDRTIMYFSRQEGYLNFQEKIAKAPRKIVNTDPVVLCDLELKGIWSKYTKVWRYLLEESYYDCREDEGFFMF